MSRAEACFEHAIVAEASADSPFILRNG